MLNAKLSLDSPAHFVKTLSFYYDKDWLDWTPEIFQATLISKFNFKLDGEKGPLIIERAEAFREILRGDRVFEDMVVYENVIHALNETHFTYGILEPCSPEELCYGNWVLDRVVGGLATEGTSEKETGWRFSEAVQAYGATCLFEGGLHFAPEELRFGAFKDGIDRLSGAPVLSKILMGASWKTIWDTMKGKKEDLTMTDFMEATKEQVDKIRGRKGSGPDMLDEDEELAARNLVRALRCVAYMDGKIVSLTDIL